MKLNLFARSSDTSVLQEWQHSLLDIFLRFSLLFALPIVILSSADNVRAGRMLLACCALGSYLVLVAAALLPWVSTRLRARIMVLTGYVVGTGLIIQNGIVGGGLLLLLLTVVLVTLLFSWRVALLVTVIVTATVTLVMTAIGVGWIRLMPDLATRFARPEMLAPNVLFMLFFAWLILAALGSLIDRLSASLRVSEVANIELERRVDERTASLQEAEHALARQLRYAEALSRCSRILLTRGSGDAAYRQILTAALDVLRVAVDADRIAAYSYPDWDQDSLHSLLQMRMMAVANAPDLPPQRPITPEVLADLPPQLRKVPPDGSIFNGPTRGSFSGHPLFERYQADNGTLSVAYLPVTISGYWWGHISVSDHRHERSWDDGAIQLLRTAAEMIATFSQGWDALQALAGSEASLRALRDALPDLIFVIDNDATIISTHLPASSHYYVPPEAFLKRKVAEVLPEPVASRLTAAIFETRRSGRMQIVEYELLMQGRLRVYEDRLLPIDSTYILSVVRDITEARQAAEAMLRAKEVAEAADRAKSAFLATMSHEIRTPLNAVIGMADLLHSTPLNGEQRGYVETILTGGETLLAVINHILEFSRIESGRLELESQPFDLRACVDAACDLVAYEAARKGLDFTHDVALDLPSAIVGDAVRLRQVLINLLSNAVKFTADGEVTLRVVREGSRESHTPSETLSFIISDTGIGLSPAQVERIFEPFVQADGATTRRYGGTGLGLAICRQLVELMGGTIGVESALGAGSIFTVRLPLRPAEPSSMSPPDVAAGSADSARSLRVLVVEDNAINQLVVLRYLARLGYQADAAESGLQAIDALRCRPYDVLLIDLEMPDLDGLEATRHIRGLGSAIAQPYIIALTALDASGGPERPRAAGIDAYLSKPIQITALQQALLNVPAD